MQKIFLNKDNWVCYRCPNNFVPDHENHFIEVEDDVYNKTLTCLPNYAWKFVNNELVETKFREFTLEETKEQLRLERENECFSIVNRGAVWYDNLSAEQREQIKFWYLAWLDVTDTLSKPEKPIWLK